LILKYKEWVGRQVTKYFDEKSDFFVNTKRYNILASNGNKVSTSIAHFFIATGPIFLRSNHSWSSSF